MLISFCGPTLFEYQKPTENSTYSENREEDFVKAPAKLKKLFEKLKRLKLSRNQVRRTAGTSTKRSSANFASIVSRPALSSSVSSHEIGLSRSLFAKRFNDLVGIPPIEYLVRWRMQLAARLLDQGASITEAAISVGYESEATFSRVFKRLAGAPPGAWRRARPKVDQPRYGHGREGEHSSVKLD